MKIRYGRMLAVALLCGAGIGGFYWINSKTTAPKQEQGKRGGRRAVQGDGPAPVTVAAVLKQSVPVYREGIGNVLALNAVTVKAQVDGRLMSIDFVEGQDVRKGDVLARIDRLTYQAQYDQAVAKKAQDQASLANAQMDLERYQRLAKTNAGPKQQADQQESLVAQLAAQVASDQAAIDNAKAILDYTTVVSPLDGRVGLRQVDPGNIVRAGDASGIVSITQLKPIAVLFTLPQRDLEVTTAALARGPVKVEIPDASRAGVIASGTLLSIDNQIDLSTGTIKLKATFPNDDLKLWPGQFVSIRVVVDMLVDAKVVPASAIRRGTAGNFVYVVGADRKAVVQPVDVVLQDEDVAVVSKGVDFAQSVVTQGFARLTDGKQVEVPRPQSDPGQSRKSKRKDPAKSSSGEAEEAAAEAKAGSLAPPANAASAVADEAPMVPGTKRGRRRHDPAAGPQAAPPEMAAPGSPGGTKEGQP